MNTEQFDSLDGLLEKELTPAQAARIQQQIQLQDEKNNFELWESRVQRHPVTGRIVYSADNDGPDTALNVKFTTERVFHKLNTLKAGGINQYIDVDFITITIPNDKFTTIHAPVTPYYEWRFRKEFDAWKSGSNVGMGIPLEKWDQVSPNDLDALRNMGVSTVEQLATMSESNAGGIRGFFNLRDRAQKFLAATDAGATSETKKKLDAQQATIDKLTEMLEKQSKVLEKLAKKGSE